MQISIIGHGNVGGALAQSLSRAGHSIHIGAQNLQDSKLSELQKLIPNLKVGSISAAVESSEAVIIAAVPPAILEICDQLKGLNANTVIIDAMNSIGAKPEPYQHTYEAIVASGISEHVVKCFNTIGFDVMLNPKIGSEQADLFIAGDSERAKAVAKELGLSIGFGNVYDFGTSAQVALLEQFAFCWINLAMMQKMGRRIGFKLLRE